MARPKLFAHSFLVIMKLVPMAIELDTASARPIYLSSTIKTSPETESEDGGGERVVKANAPTPSVLNTSELAPLPQDTPSLLGS